MIRFIAVLVLSVLLAPGCKKKDFDTSLQEGENPTIIPKRGQQAPQGNGANPFVFNPIAPDAQQAVGGGGGAAQSVRKAVARTVDAKDLQDLNLFIQSYSLENDRMPDAATILAVLKKEPGMARLAKDIEEGFVVLTNIRQREGVWAYDKSVLTGGGMVLTNQGVERLTAQELQARLKQQ